MTQQDENKSLLSELERRIEELEDTDEKEFGSFSRLDWLLLVLLCVVIPVVLALAFR